MQIPQIRTNQTETSSVCDHRQLYKNQKSRLGAQKPCKDLGTFAGPSATFSASMKRTKAKAGSRVFPSLY